MGAGQIGGIATLLDIDFENAAGFMGHRAPPTEAQFIVYYFSQALMFCVGTLIEPHIILTPAMCVYGERSKFEVYGGTHTFLENSGITRIVHHLSVHRGYNHTKRYVECITDNFALLVLSKQFSFNVREPNSEYILNRLRYGVTGKPPLLDDGKKVKPVPCTFFGWGSRRNGYLIPLLINLKRMDVLLHPKELCGTLWNKDNKYLCIEQPPCRSADYGALCPDDVGTVLVCSGFARGMMISRLVDRPCGVGFVDLALYNKFLTCGVDDSRDVITHDEFMVFEFTTLRSPTPSVVVPPIIAEHEAELQKNKMDNENNNNNNEKKESDDDDVTKDKNYKTSSVRAFYK